MRDDELVEVLNSFALYLDEQITRPAVEEIKSAVDGLNLNEPKSISEMVGEYLREAAVLILIFVPLDLLIPRADRQQKTMDPKWFVATLALSLVMLSAGIWRERRK